MADIFISYASSDRDRVIPLVEVFERQGYEVWWDRQIGLGVKFDREIEIEIENARCIVVIWSKASLESDWVRAEANEALDRKVLVPVVIDDVKPPLAFRTIQSSKLTNWPSTRSADSLNNILAAISLLLSGVEPKAAEVVQTEALDAEKTIAVLPFRSLSPDPDDAFFAEGLADEIINVLTRIPDLNVASRTSSFQFKDGQGGDSRAIGAQLNVRYLLEGSVRKSGSQLRVSVQLIQAVDGYSLWSRTFNNTIEDIFAVQDEIATRVASALKSTLWETSLTHQAFNRTTNTEAYQAYLLAMHFDREMHQGGLEEEEQVRRHAERAVALDPDYVPAWLLLADVYLNRMGYRMPLEESQPLARNALNRALALDPDNPDVLLKLAELSRGDHEYREAAQLFERVRVLNPESPILDYATLLFTVGHMNEAIREFQLCIETDPENFALWFYYAAAQVGAGDLDAALESYEKSLVIAGNGFLSDGVRATIAGTYTLKNDLDTARERLTPCLKFNANRTDFEKGVIAGIQAMIGDHDEAISTVRELEDRAETIHIDPQAMFWVYLGLDDKEKSFYWMEQVVQEDSFPTIFFLKTWPMFDPLRDDARYDQLLEKAGIF